MPGLSLNECAWRVLAAIVLLAGFANAQSMPGQPAPGQKTTPDSSQTPSAPQTPIEFELHGMLYQALTKDGITVVFAPLPPHIKDFNIIQITVTNGSLVSWTVTNRFFLCPSGRYYASSRSGRRGGCFAL